jgi:hypothetical protein
MSAPNVDFRLFRLAFPLRVALEAKLGCDKKAEEIECILLHPVVV